ncbi:NAD-binding protein [Prescottella defluvii]|nr:NAD-binding protein [Prescottella defluvii]
MAGAGAGGARRCVRPAHSRRRRRSAASARVRPDRVLVIGAGFTGTEVASACRELGVPVTVVASVRPRCRGAGRGDR